MQEIFCKVLRELRKSNGITQRELGNLIEKKEITIRKYESGKIMPDIKTLIALADYFNVSLDYLTGHEKQ